MGGPWSYLAKRDSASLKVTSPKSTGSMSGPRSRFALTGTKNDLTAKASSSGILCDSIAGCDDVRERHL
jgi:hypothetical protein